MAYLTGAELHADLVREYQLAKYRYDQLAASDPFHFQKADWQNLGNKLFQAETALANESTTAARNQAALDSESQRKADEAEFKQGSKSAQSRLDTYKSNYSTYAQSKVANGATPMSFEQWAKAIGYDYAADQTRANATYSPPAGTSNPYTVPLLASSMGSGASGPVTVTAPTTTTPTTTTPATTTNTPNVTVPTGVTTPTTTTTTPATATTNPSSWLGTITGQNNTTDTRAIRNPLGDTSADWITNLFGGNKTRVANPFSQTTRSVKTPFSNYGQLYNYQR